MRRFQPTPQWSRIPGNLTDKEKIDLLSARLNEVLQWIDEVANLPALKDHSAAALTASTGLTINTGDADSDDEIENMRTRIAELEAALQGYALLPQP